MTIETMTEDEARQATSNFKQRYPPFTAEAEPNPHETGTWWLHVNSPWGDYGWFSTLEGQHGFKRFYETWATQRYGHVPKATA